MSTQVKKVTPAADKTQVIEVGQASDPLRGVVQDPNLHYFIYKPQRGLEDMYPPLEEYLEAGYRVVRKIAENWVILSIEKARFEATERQVWKLDEQKRSAPAMLMTEASESTVSLSELAPDVVRMAKDGVTFANG